MIPPFDLDPFDMLGEFSELDQYGGNVSDVKVGVGVSVGVFVGISVGVGVCDGTYFTLYFRYER